MSTGPRGMLKLVGDAFWMLLYVGVHIGIAAFYVWVIVAFGQWAVQTGREILESDSGVENSPWPLSETDAVKKCLFAIETRNWDNYTACFEPGAILERQPPGPPGKFDAVDILPLQIDESTGTAIVQVEGIWIPSFLVGNTQEEDNLSSGAIYIYEKILVVRARRGLLVDNPLNLDVAVEGWFVAYSEQAKLPFNFGSMQPTEEIPLPVATP